MIDQAIHDLAGVVGIMPACEALGRSRAGFYRRHRPAPARPRTERPPRPQPRALSPAERREVLSLLHDPAHADEAPRTVYARLLDEGRYLCSASTMYRILRAAGEVKERRRQATHILRG